MFLVLRGNKKLLKPAVHLAGRGVLHSIDNTQTTKGWTTTAVQTMRHLLRISYFWPGWYSYVRLGVFHTTFSTKEVTYHSYFFPKSHVFHQILNNYCRVL